MNTHVELISDVHAMLGEGPCWHTSTQQLYWVDILGKSVHCYNPATATEQGWALPEQPGCVVARQEGGLILAVESGFATFEPRSNQYELVCPVEHARAGMRFNDGKCDPYGRLWAGTMNIQKPRAAVGKLYCLEPDFTLRVMETNITVSNGLTWNPDYTVMYYIDTPTHQVVAYDYDGDTGAISGKRVAIEIPHDLGSPDGMTADREGMLWIAIWGGWQVTRWNPYTGQLLAGYDVPVGFTTSCCFGGPDLTDLYITTAQPEALQQPSRPQPHAGGLFRLKTTIPGLKTFTFGGYP